VNPTWTTVGDLVSVLRKRWDSGIYLRAYALGEPWQPITLPVKGPGAVELLERFDQARSWATVFEHDARNRDGSPRFTVEVKTVHGRNLGTNHIPARITVESFEQLCQLLRTTDEVRDWDRLLEQTRDRVPAALPWVAQHPRVALGCRDVWTKVVATVEWITAHDNCGLYLRQLDVDGVDTKFVERHQKLLDALLTAVLPRERINPLIPRSDFSRRFGFASKPSYTRFRILDPGIGVFPKGVTELTLRTDELAEHALEATTVFIIENEVTYLSFPEVTGSIVVFGSGFARGGVRDLPWLHETEVVYWGDIDTHGFDILSRLRNRIPVVKSMLMDTATLVAHKDQWVSEPTPTNRALLYLTPDESSLYRDLVEDRFGRNIRLEQERIRFSLLDQALIPWSTRSQPGVS
jgi:hypothetical protein